MKRIFIIAAMLIVYSGILPAQEACYPADQLENDLQEEYNEQPIRRGLSGSSFLYEWWESPTGTFSILRRSPNGELCFVGAGDYSHEVLRPPEGEES